MSRRDIAHEPVKQALIKEGWLITHDPYYFDSIPRLSTDLGAERILAAQRESEKIAVEIKSFLAESQVAELEKALGQYGLYRRLLTMQEPERTLYLAVPLHAYQNIFTKQVGQIAIEEFRLQLIVFSPEGDLIWERR